MTNRTIDELRAQLARIERRPESATLTVRAAEGDETPRIAMFIPYDTPANIGNLFTEFVARGAFKRSLQLRSSDVVALWNHDSSRVLGRESNGTLRFKDGDDGLEAVVTLNPKSRDHHEYMETVGRGDVKNASFAFEVVKEAWRNTDEGTIERTLQEVKLYDVSPVTYPAYAASESEVRARAILGLVDSARGGKLPHERVREAESLIAELRSLIPEPEGMDDYDLHMARLDRANRIAKGLLRKSA